MKSLLRGLGSAAAVGVLVFGLMALVASPQAVAGKGGGKGGGGGSCQTNFDCGFFSGEYCKKDVGDCDGTGVCTPRPQNCLDVYIPVCGCDLNNYSNACYAARAGVSLLSLDSCPF